MNGNRKRIMASLVFPVMLFIALVLACVAYSDKSVAWFATNTDVNANGMSIGVYSDLSVGVRSICVYKVDENNNNATLYANPSAFELKEILTLNQFDSVFEEKRENTPIIIKATLTNFKSGSLAANVTVTISLKAQTGYTQTNGSKEVLMPYISNFINVCCSADTRLDDASKTPAEYYSYARDLFLGDFSSQTKTFVGYTESGASTNIQPGKSGEMVFTVEKPEGQDMLDVYLFLGYDENLIARYISDNEKIVGSVEELEEYFAWGAQIPFLNDIAKISFAEVGDEP